MLSVTTNAPRAHREDIAIEQGRNSPLRSPSAAPAQPPPGAGSLPAGVQQLLRQQPIGLLATTQLANAREAEVLEHAAVKKLPSHAQADLRAIIKTLRSGPEAERLYYLSKLRLLLDTPWVRPKKGDPSELEKHIHASVEDSLAAYARQQARGGVDSTREEVLSAADRSWTRRTGPSGKTFLIDATRLEAIIVQVKVKLTFVHCAELKEKIPALEDAIEKSASTRGYDVNLVFTRRSGPDVFELRVNDRQWPNEENWAGGADVLAHELHHALGLDDRYDRIESHADNPYMPMAERLYWFREELRKGPDPRRDFSKMSDESQPLLAEDICALVPGNPERCLDARLPLDPRGLPKLEAGWSPHP